MPNRHVEAEAPVAQGRCDRSRWDRLEAAQKRPTYLATAGTGSECSRAKEVGVARSTLRRWEQSYPRDDEEARFFADTVGLRVLQRVALAATLTYQVPGTDGVRKLEQFLKFSGLGRYVAHSRGALHKLAAATMMRMNEFEAQVLSELKFGIETKRQITICLDETFHPRVCLVAMEPVSGFILVESYAEKRDAETWIAALREAVSGLAVEVVQATSDEGKAILRVVREELHASHSPDVFHVQHEVAKRTMAALSAQARAAERVLEQATAATEARMSQAQAAQQEPRGPGRPPNYERRITEAKAAQTAAQAALTQAKTNRDEMREVIQDLSKHYHPYELQTGQVRTTAKLKDTLDGLLEKARAVAARAQLSQRCVHAIEKAGRVMDGMVDTLRVFHDMVAEHVAVLPIRSELQTAVLTLLIPALYLQRAARKARLAEQRDGVEEVAQRLLSQLRDLAAWQELDHATRNLVMNAACWCAELFQRSSSCVEGRNGQLSLFHHAMHRLSVAKLHALTIIHNYFIRRSDGTTAAQRFFGQRHEDLFEWLLARTPVPPAPAPRQARGDLNRQRHLLRRRSTSTATAPPS
jgi:hypothetical protein